MLVSTVVVLLCALAQLDPAQAGPSAAAISDAKPAQAPTAPAPAVVRLAAGTPVEVVLAEPLSSSINHLADTFVLRLAEPITSNGAEVVAAGARGQGEVIDVARAGINGKQGKLIISARYLDLNGRRVRIRGMTFMASGKSHVDLATGVLMVPYVGVASMFIRGGEIEIPEGARAVVKLAEDVDLPTTAPTDQTGKSQ